MFEPGIGRAVLGEEVNLAGAVAFINGFDGPVPGGAVAVVDLAEIEQGFLDGPATCDAAVFDDTPVAVYLAVLDTFVGTQKHISAWSLPPNGRACLWAGSPPQAFSEGTLSKIKDSSASEGQNQTIFETNSGSRVNNDAIVPLTPEQVEWADVILVMEKEHRNKLNGKYKRHLNGQRVIVLGIPDNYECMDPALVELLKAKVTPLL